MERIIRCDCCGTEKLGVVKDGKLIISRRRRGRKHNDADPRVPFL
ncbi:MAG: hypothetical protein V3S82_07240 [Dehalococcoidia bacterium]